MLKVFEFLIFIMCAPFILGLIAWIWKFLIEFIKLLYKGDL